MSKALVCGTIHMQTRIPQCPGWAYDAQRLSLVNQLYFCPCWYKIIRHIHNEDHDVILYNLLPKPLISPYFIEKLVLQDMEHFLQKDQGKKK